MGQKIELLEPRRRGAYCIEELDDIADFSLVKKNQKLLPYFFVKKHVVLALELLEGVVVLAISDPLNLEAVIDCSHLLNRRVVERLVARDVLLEQIEKVYSFNSKDETLGASDDENNSDCDSVYDLLDAQEPGSSSELLNRLIILALDLCASDIHFEPVESKMIVHYRLDGQLVKKHEITSSMKLNIISRIKVLSNLDIAEKRRPQDGRMKLSLGGNQIDFRVSSVPVVSGERIVLRILDSRQLNDDLSDSGMNEETISFVNDMVKKSQGLFLVTGPTGSGKTTTLYAALTLLEARGLNIMTIEDPVEYKKNKIAQMAVNPKIGVTFASGLRHILRQDPDVIMIGEIRDFETAQIAIQASLTGHLVLSTLHTNDAPSALARLVDMGIEPYLLSSSIVGVLSQRLVRRICGSCREPIEASEHEKRIISNMLGEPFEAPLYHAKGCSECGNTGFIGRVGLFEPMRMNAALQKAITHTTESNSIKKVAIESGMVTMNRYAANFILEGVTSLSEVLRVTSI